MKTSSDKEKKMDRVVRDSSNRHGASQRILRNRFWNRHIPQWPRPELQNGNFLS